MASTDRIVLTNARRLLERALELLAADRPLTFKEWREAFDYVQDAHHALAGDAATDLADLGEDERRALFDPATLRQNPETEIP